MKCKNCEGCACERAVPGEINDSWIAIAVIVAALLGFTGKNWIKDLPGYPMKAAVTAEGPAPTLHQRLFGNLDQGAFARIKANTPIGTWSLR